MEDLEILKWREAKTLAVADHELAEEFAARAAEVRSQVSFLLNGGLTDGVLLSMSTSSLNQWATPVWGTFRGGPGGTCGPAALARVRFFLASLAENFPDQRSTRSYLIPGRYVVVFTDREVFLENLQNG